jgi:hypothetical protein
MTHKEKIFDRVVGKHLLRSMLLCMKHHHMNQVRQMHYALKRTGDHHLLILTFYDRDGELCTSEHIGTIPEIARLVMAIDKKHFYQRPSLDG